MTRKEEGEEEEEETSNHNNSNDNNMTSMITKDLSSSFSIDDIKSLMEQAEECFDRHQWLVDDDYDSDPCSDYYLKTRGKNYCDLKESEIEWTMTYYKYSKEKATKEIALAAVCHDNENLKYLPEELKNDKELHMVACCEFYGDMEEGEEHCIPQWVREDKKITLVAMQSDYWDLKDVSSQLQNDKEVVWLHVPMVGIPYNMHPRYCKMIRKLLWLHVPKMVWQYNMPLQNYKMIKKL